MLKIFYNHLIGTLKCTLVFLLKLTASAKNFVNPQAFTAWSYDAAIQCVADSVSIQCESKKSPLKGPDISHFPHKRLRIFNRFFTHLLYVPIYTRLQIFIQLSPTLTNFDKVMPY